MDAMKTGALIAQARKEKGLTQRELAEQVYVSVQAVSKWELGKNFPDLPLMEPVGAALGLTVTALVAGQRGEEPGEEAVRDTLRFSLAQLGPKIRRWKWLFLLAAVLLLGLLAWLGYARVRELSPQPETILTPIDLEERQNALVDLLSNQDGDDFLHMYDLTLADDMDGAVIRAELWTHEGLSKSWELLNMSAFHSEHDFSRSQLLAFRMTLRKDGSLPYRIRLGNSVVSGISTELQEAKEASYLGNGMAWNFAETPTVVDREHGAALLEIYLIEDQTMGIRTVYDNLREGAAALVVRLCWQ